MAYHWPQVDISEVNKTNLTVAILATATGLVGPTFQLPDAVTLGGYVTGIGLALVFVYSRFEGERIKWFKEREQIRAASAAYKLEETQKKLDEAVAKLVERDRVAEEREKHNVELERLVAQFARWNLENMGHIRAEERVRSSDEA